MTPGEQRAPDASPAALRPQAGIVDAQQRHLALAAFDVHDALHGEAGRAALADLLRHWTFATRELVAGRPLARPLGALTGQPGPPDTGETTELDAAGLTITAGFGPALFDPARGLLDPARRPAELEDLPRFEGDVLAPEWSGGDLVVAAASDDQQVALHAVRTLARIGRGTARWRWLQHGFLPARGDADGVPRNLMGFKDGISMLRHDDLGVARALLWAGDDSPDWIRGGGTYLVVRRIRMLLDDWDRLPVVQQEEIVGRSKETGELPAEPAKQEPMPLLAVRGPAAAPERPQRSHTILARSAAASGQQILRRPYSYSAGVDPQTGQLDAGLLFLSFQRSISQQFVPMQQLLAASDAMNAHTRHIGSAVFAIPPAPLGDGDWLGSALLS